MQTSLSTYRRKRDFKVTPEPQGRARRGGGRTQFVIQRHDARQLHFDFRLELDGVLKSWAVPKGPSETVGERRLAVEVEDHPLDYARFEGDIPAGQYGAGHVDIWDRGTWKAIGDPRQGLREGHLKFDLAGRRLHGRWALVRMKPRNGGGKNNWLLIRERDPAPDAAGLREDKPATDVEKPMEATTTAPARHTKRSSARAKPASASKPEVAGIAISNPDRVIADSDGVTKLDVARYHFDVAKWLLPHVVDRPLAVVKCPGGNLAHCFFQRHPGDAGRTRNHAPDTPPYLHFKTIEDVVAAVQNGAFEFHAWGVSFPRLDRPDRITLDLDPDTSLGWSAVREACELTRALLDRLELRWFLKTTGGKGLHFVLPLVPRYGWDEVKTFARGLATELARTSPKLFIATMSKQKRSGRVFVDYLRNADGATAVAAYSLRARNGLPVSMPIAWSAINQDVRGAFFNVRNVRGILRRRKTDPWADYEAARQRITVAMRKAVGGVS